MNNIHFGLKVVRRLHFGESHFRRTGKWRTQITQSPKVLLGNNTLRTNKLGLNLYADHDLKEITFNLSPQYSNPFFTYKHGKDLLTFFIDVWCISSVALYPLACASPSKDNPAIETKHYACMLFFYLRVRD
jgi:hypothetical protein